MNESNILEMENYIFVLKQTHKKISPNNFIQQDTLIWFKDPFYKNCYKLISINEGHRKLNDKEIIVECRKYIKKLIRKIEKEIKCLESNAGYQELV